MNADVQVSIDQKGRPVLGDPSRLHSVGGRREESEREKGKGEERQKGIEDEG